MHKIIVSFGFEATAQELCSWSRGLLSETGESVQLIEYYQTLFFPLSVSRRLGLVYDLNYIRLTPVKLRIIMLVEKTNHMIISQKLLDVNINEIIDNISWGNLRSVE